MPAEARLLLAFGGALALAYLLTPLAIRLAWATDFLDRPRGYKQHGRATPYLGGCAVIGALVPVALVLGGTERRILFVVGGAVVLWALGTLDDRRPVGPLTRVTVEVAVAALLWAVGAGWAVFGSGLLDLALTAFWIVGVVNAFNLFDNLDGAAGTIGAMSGAGLGTLAAVQGDFALAALAFALSGACAGFLPRNLAGPARVFLGDGGSMPVGFVVAAGSMSISLGGRGHWAALLAAVMLAGLPILDTTLVVVSRVRRGISVLTGGRDHLTHRLLQRLGSARTVALSLGGAQALIAVVAIAGSAMGPAEVAVTAALYAVAVLVTIRLLETGPWAPPPARVPA